VNLLPNHIKTNGIQYIIAINVPVPAVEKDSISTSSRIWNAVYNSDVTMDNVSAHKQYSFPWVSEFVDEDSDG
jgi:hypothetical protein